MFFLGVASSSGGMLAYCPVLCRSRDACIVHGVSHVSFILSGRPSMYSVRMFVHYFVRALVSIATLLDLFNKYLTNKVCVFLTVFLILVVSEHAKAASILTLVMGPVSAHYE